MVLRRTPLTTKEDQSFREALKLYDAKQYKKALKLVDQTLKKTPNHAESLTLKGCINFFVGSKTEADLYVRKGVARAPLNHLVDHLAGIYYRNAENYAEAAKWYKAALDNGSSNKQILRDLATMQVQTRDYKNLVATRQLYLEEQPGFRANWTALAVAQHLAGNPAAAVQTLTKIEEMIRDHLSESDMVEHSECLLYKASILAEAGSFERALAALAADEPHIKDKSGMLELRARVLMGLERPAEAARVYRQLLQRNPDNAHYYRQLEAALGPLSVDRRVQLYARLAQFYPRSDPPRFLPLTFVPASDARFAELCRAYILAQLKRGVPSSFINVKPLYHDAAKMAVVERVVTAFYEEEVPGLAPTVAVWTKYFLAQHYLHKHDLAAAQKFIDDAIEHSPTLVELYVVQARVLKHRGELAAAAAAMDAGRQLDLQDRFINSKATKYFFRANDVDRAIDTISMFTKVEDGAVNGCRDLHLMQVGWVLLESAEAYARLYAEAVASAPAGADDAEAADASADTADIYRGLALKRFHAVVKLFDVFYNDQLDFHSYCMRRGTPRDYVDLVRWEDTIHATPIYGRAVRGLSALYLEIYEQQQQPAAKPRRPKPRKQELKRREALIAKVASEKDDRDPLGLGLLHALATNGTGKVLDRLLELCKPLLARDSESAWRCAFAVYVRQGKYVLALQAVKRVQRAGGDAAPLVAQLRRAVADDAGANAAIVEVVHKGLSAFD
ncbi:N-terminal acetyltransferase A complex subunit NAT1 [[Candida] zeylanoides]